MSNKIVRSIILIFFLSHFSNGWAETTYRIEGLFDSHGIEIEGWLNNTQAFEIKLANDTVEQSSSVQLAEYPVIPQFQIYIGDSDVTEVFTYKDGRIEFTGGIPLPVGENQLTIKLLSDNEWQIIGELPIKVLSSAGFKQASWTPRLEINTNSQLDEHPIGEATASEKATYTDVTANIGLVGSHQRDDLTIDSSFDFLSVSNRQQAIQFGSKENRARKFDLMNYSVTVQNGNHNIVMGHTSYGSHPLLIDSLSRRGISWQYQGDSQLSFNGALLNGSDIVGFDNFTGLSNHNEQYVNSLGVAYNAFSESRISVLMEATYLDAVKQSVNDFGIGEIASAEESQGLGFKFVASDTDARFNGELSVALSRYSNPDDDSLSFGDQLLQLDSETAIAHNLSLSYVLVQDWESQWGSNVNLVINGSHNKAEPLYQTLTAYIQANVISKHIGAQYQVGSVSGNYDKQYSQDNLDNIVSILTTRTENENFNAHIPLASIFADENADDGQPSWLPELQYSYQSSHQFAVNSPDQLFSGFNGASHLPDQLTNTHTIASSWQLEQHSISLQSNHTEQDNRQIDRENSDFSNLQHMFNFNWQQDDQSSWTFSVARNRQFDLENLKIQYSNTIGVSYSYQSMSGLGLNINYGLSKEEDSLDEAENTACNADIGLVKNLVKGDWWFPADGNISLRINYNESKSFNRIFNFQNRFGTIVAQLGISLSF